MTSGGVYTAINTLGGIKKYTLNPDYSQTLTRESIYNFLKTLPEGSIVTICNDEGQDYAMNGTGILHIRSDNSSVIIRGIITCGTKTLVNTAFFNNDILGAVYGGSSWSYFHPTPNNYDSLSIVAIS